MLIGLGVATTLAWAAPKVGAVLTVRVLNAKVMKTPKFIGPAAGDASRGTKLTVAEVKGDWYRVAGAFDGWIHKTNVTERAVELSARPGGENDGSASTDEVELAGRGFTPQVEEKYRSDNPTLDFDHVDRIEKFSIDPAELEAFVAEGGLGGAQ